MPQATYPDPMRAALLGLYLVLLQAGFTMPRRVTTRAVRSYRTISTLPFLLDPPYKRKTLQALGGVFSAALSVGSRPPGVTWHSALWSPDFPPLKKFKSDCLADSAAQD